MPIWHCQIEVVHTELVFASLALQKSGLDFKTMLDLKTCKKFLCVEI